MVDGPCCRSQSPQRWRPTKFFQTSLEKARWHRSTPVTYDLNLGRWCPLHQFIFASTRPITYAIMSISELYGTDREAQPIVSNCITALICQWRNSGKDACEWLVARSQPFQDYPLGVREPSECQLSAASPIAYFPTTAIKKRVIVAGQSAKFKAHLQPNLKSVQNHYS